VSVSWGRGRGVSWGVPFHFLAMWFEKFGRSSRHPRRDLITLTFARIVGIIRRVVGPVVVAVVGAVSVVVREVSSFVRGRAGVLTRIGFGSAAGVGGACWVG
jgi:hypothetical protein